MIALMGLNFCIPNISKLRCLDIQSPCWLLSPAGEGVGELRGSVRRRLTFHIRPVASVTFVSLTQTKQLSFVVFKVGGRISDFPPNL